MQYLAKITICEHSVMKKPSYNKEQNARIDEWLTLCSQSYIEVGSKDYFDLMILMSDDEQVVIDTVVAVLAKTVTYQ
jgi:hypothetical protein